jgi:hypothetical protein
MIRLTRLILILIISIATTTIGYAQQQTDSILLDNEALKMIHFPNPEFKSAFVPNMDKVLDWVTVNKLS